MPTDSVSPSAFDWAEKETKRANDTAMRIHMAESILSTPRSGFFHCLTLPADQWEFERNLAASFEKTAFVFDGVERDSKVHRRSAKRITKLEGSLPNATFGLCAKPSSLGEIIENEAWRNYDLVYADWMGTWSEEKKEEVTKMFEKGIFNESAWLGMTLMLARGQPSSMQELMRWIDEGVQFTEDLSFTMDDKSIERVLAAKQGLPKTFGVSGFIKKLAAKHGYEASRVRIAVYDNMAAPPRRTPEISLLMKLERR